VEEVVAVLVVAGQRVEAVQAIQMAALLEKRDKSHLQLLGVHPQSPRGAQAEMVPERPRSRQTQREVTNPLHVINANHLLPNNQQINREMVQTSLNRPPLSRLDIFQTSTPAYQIEVSRVIKINAVKIP
jgi:hypothetical protein